MMMVDEGLIIKYGGFINLDNIFNGGISGGVLTPGRGSGDVLFAGVILLKIT